MATVDLVMPKMGESIMEATILKWHKQPGDAVKMDETVLEIATDKVDTEVPSIAEGVVEEILYNVNDVIPVGTVIARVKTAAGEYNPPGERSGTPGQTSGTTSQKSPENEGAETGAANVLVNEYKVQNSNNGPSNRFYSPLVLNIAASEGVSLTELEKITGTGNE